MKEVGNISDFTVEQLQEFKPVKLSTEDVDADGKLKRTPKVPLGHQIIAKVDYGETSEAQFYLCKDFSDMQKFQAAQLAGSGVVVDWFSVKN